ncbi:MULTISPECIES: efflux RND transporter periplasmic adaptor subunit [unclassified Acinetobacter]|uniref:efflux RND transporter periplasmic adaptor subunit n=1 Tax=unclassified Acinetobacter TaxID=196816 RepID=UPI0019097D54|nr:MULTISPECIES: efflux RND transporter periplasmic adaptor subunit [unclassified Acinetobacter]MBK0062902.1 efflux RND transporter periplasmic adaptor subunit [Acinetobacter sp. S55]MBK0065521.1 efflux RND transporter periplasmic adaptor subunit [Acinetobacter sp. S54]
MSLKNIKKQWLWVGLVMSTCILFSLWMVLKDSSKINQQTEDGHGEAESTHAHDEREETKHSEESKALNLTPQQMLEFGVKLAQVQYGAVSQSLEYPAKLIANTDQQAHVASTFTGRVESVNVLLGQQVKKGQVLATIFIPELVDQQATLSIAQEVLTLAQQDYQREKQLFDQGISARQDYQKAYNAYRQAQIQVQAARTRLSALGTSAGSQGRYALKAPLSGVVSQKDIVVGEYITSDKQLFVIDQLNQLWLEFIMPSAGSVTIQPNQQIDFRSLQTQNSFKAQVQTLTTEADSQTGRLRVRAKVLTPAQELRPNLMVNVTLQAHDGQPVLRVSKNAIQQVDGKSVVFVAKSEKNLVHFEPIVVEVGNYSSDGQWVEIKSGLTTNQQYVSQGSFLLKSEMEKGDAEHGH